jgi:hypothetical protein
LRLYSHVMHIPRNKNRRILKREVNGVQMSFPTVHIAV